MRELVVPSHGSWRISLILSEGVAEGGPYDKNLRRVGQVARARTRHARDAWHDHGGQVSHFSRHKAAVTAAACGVIGWDYRLVGEPDPVWAANLRWLSGYRHPRFGDEQLEELLVSLFASSQPLSAAGQAGDPIRVRPVLFHLLWRGRLSADLGRPLGETTALTACSDPMEAA
jgi:hypothetical protein